MTATATADEFTALTSPHIPRLMRLGMRLTRDNAEAADLVQDAMCRAWTNWERFRHDGRIGAYLARIVVNTFISRHRHAKVVATAAARSDLVDHLFEQRRMDAASDPERVWHDDGLSDEVADALGSLPIHYRSVVELVDLGGMPYRDAADRLGVPLGTIMSRLHRARRLMRDKLAAYARSFGYGLVPAAAAA